MLAFCPSINGPVGFVLSDFLRFISVVALLFPDYLDLICWIGGMFPVFIFVLFSYFQILV